MAHLTADLNKVRLRKITFSAKWPPHPRAEGGQVEPVLGRFAAIVTIFSLYLQWLSSK